MNRAIECQRSSGLAFSILLERESLLNRDIELLDCPTSFRGPISGVMIDPKDDEDTEDEYFIVQFRVKWAAARREGHPWQLYSYFSPESDETQDSDENGGNPSIFSFVVNDLAHVRFTPLEDGSLKVFGLDSSSNTYRIRPRGDNLKLDQPAKVSP